ncbi:MAG: DUF294 nucleotidyltransferase-like domain-containing protein [Candidatus Sumerlaeia bacterium]
MQSTSRIDFHCHSNLSDGYFPPETVAEKMALAGVRYAALTDHNTLEGQGRFHSAFARKGGRSVTGVEVTSRYNDVSLHLLIYGFDLNHPHIRSVLKNESDIADVLDIFHEAHGRVFLAHPLSVWPDTDTVRQELRKLRELGLDGVEAYHPTHSSQQQKEICRIARNLGMPVVGGSDFHGPNISELAQPGMDVDTQDWKHFRDALPDFDAPERPKHVREVHGEALPAFSWGTFVMRVLLPAILAVLLFVGALFFVILPTLKQSFLERKREMIRELTNSAWSVLAEYEREVKQGRLTLEEAKELAIERIRYLRYGRDGKDYFWITDMRPHMVMHPYRPDLEGKDVSHFEDPSGNQIFEEFVEVVKKRDHGYVDYVWQWKDDPERVEPKESYVRGFEPWGWVIGTGIYLEDVQKEVSAIMSRLIDISFAITAIVGLLLLIIMQQSLRTENKRRHAERDLQDSHEKYRALVEASTEGTLMTLDKRCVFANQTMLEMLGYGEDELTLLDLQDIIAVEEDSDEGVPGVSAAARSLLEGRENVPAQFEARVKRKDGLLIDAIVTPTPMEFEGIQGHIIVVRDVTHHKHMEEELGESRAKFRTLTQNISLGVFRAALGARGTFLEINQAARNILGIEEEAALSKVRLTDIFADKAEREHFYKILYAEEKVKDFNILARRTDGSTHILKVFAVLVRDDSGGPRFCDGILEDITERKRSQAEQEKLIAEFQTSLLFLNDPIKHYMREPLRLRMDHSIRAAAQAMNRKKCSAVAVISEKGEAIGIVTDHDLRERVLAGGIDPERPIYEIMSSPVHACAGTALVFEALLVMRQNGVRHLLVRDRQDQVTGLIRNKELLQFHRYSPAVLTREIQRASDVEAIMDARKRLPRLVMSLVESGARPRNICRAISGVSHAVVHRLVEMGIAKLGPPPVRFAFLALGSEGREEQTLVTDQDNAIVYEDIADKDLAAEARDYFMSLGKFVCQRLDMVGYAFCKGDAMAQNPRWNQPLEKWKQYFSEWIALPDSEELLRFNIYFDFRGIYGDIAMVDQLRDHVRGRISRQKSFFMHFARNALAYKPPVGMFGQLLTGASGSDSRTLSIKDAMIPLVHFARLYALQQEMEETNTFERLDRLRADKILRQDNYRDTLAAYSFLMQLRLKHQAELIADEKQPDNFINPKVLSHLDASTIKQAFSQIGLVQKKISYDFLGGAS